MALSNCKHSAVPRPKHMNKNPTSSDNGQGDPSERWFQRPPWRNTSDICHLGVDSIETYIATPKNNKTPEKAIIFLTDIFGIFSNSKLLADEFAKNGYLTIIPDLFQGDQISTEVTDSGKADLPAWLPKHQTVNVEPWVAASIKYALETLAIKKLGAVGYCFGAKYVARFFEDHQIDVGFMAHPSFVTHEELNTIEGPLSIAAAETDSIFTTKLRHESEEILIKGGLPWQINLFSGVKHGFAVRGDPSIPSQK
ncbi:unnamed protein product [Penicillium manginii]